jgi:predicted kinase
MEAVIFIGIQASGKSTYYRERFFKTHVRINLDMLKTRNREKILFEACLSAGQSFVIDNTNPTEEDRKRYTGKAREAGFQVIAYYFTSGLEEAARRNSAREGRENIPFQGIRNTHSKMVPPSYDEGFDSIYHVSIDENNNFITEEVRL